MVIVLKALSQQVLDLKNAKSALPPTKLNNPMLQSIHGVIRAEPQPDKPTARKRSRAKPVSGAAVGSSARLCENSVMP